MSDTVSQATNRLKLLSYVTAPALERRARTGANTPTTPRRKVRGCLFRASAPGLSFGACSLDVG